MKRWPRRISPRRAAFGGTICLILGVVTTVGVAWTLVRLSPQTRAIPTAYEDIEQYGDEMRHRATVKWERLTSHGEFDPLDLTSYEDPRAKIQYSMRIARGLGWEVREYFQGFMVQSGSRFYDVVNTYTESRAGWPLHCLVGNAPNVPPTGTVPPQFAIVVGGEYDSGIGPLPRLLPFYPLFPGFLINTLFYAAIWFGLFFAMGRTRRFIRTRRGRCPRCGYDLRGEFDDGCSECGWGRSDD